MFVTVCGLWEREFERKARVFQQISSFFTFAKVTDPENKCEGLKKSPAPRWAEELISLDSDQNMSKPF